MTAWFVPAAALVCAAILDACIGDPRWLPHPVRWIGNGALRLEPVFRRWFGPRERLAGIACAATVDALAAGGAFGAVWLAGVWHPAAGFAVTVIAVHFSIAAGDLAFHARRVHHALEQDGLEAGQKAVSFMVGRDTTVLDETGVVRACIESVGENMTDGVLAAVFFAVLGGLAGGLPGMACGAMFYRAANTLDSTFGYKNERYFHFGWFAARLDDVLTYIPARLTPLPVALVACLLRGSPMAVLRLAWRDGRNHASPNSGYAEASMAAALGVQLGGPTYYKTGWRNYPTVGNATRPLERIDILRAAFVMHAGSALFILAGVLILLM